MSEKEKETKTIRFGFVLVHFIHFIHRNNHSFFTNELLNLVQCSVVEVNKQLGQIFVRDPKQEGVNKEPRQFSFDFVFDSRWCWLNISRCVEWFLDGSLVALKVECQAWTNLARQLHTTINLWRDSGSHCGKCVGRLQRYHLCVWSNRYRQDLHHGRSRRSSSHARCYPTRFCTCFWENSNVTREKGLSPSLSLMLTLVCFSWFHWFIVCCLCIKTHADLPGVASGTVISLWVVVELVLCWCL